MDTNSPNEMARSPYDAWLQAEHVNRFSTWDSYSTSRLVKLCDQFNECQFFRTLVGDESCRTLSDIGCATGRCYRFFHKLWPSLEYKGYDISEGAIERARKLYPDGDFKVIDGSFKTLPEVQADIVFCRDVVLHQVDPCQFLSDLYEVANRYLILRLRTREVGATVFDISRSCQYNYGSWVPYLVFNTSELIDLIKTFEPTPTAITIRRHPVVLGGYHSRFLPKELYYPETDSAETALIIEKGSNAVGNKDTVVTIETRPESRGRERAQWVQLLRRLAGAAGIGA